MAVGAENEAAAGVEWDGRMPSISRSVHVVVISASTTIITLLLSANFTGR